MEFIVQELPILLCMLLGVGLVVLEMFMPGFGVPGIAGCVLLIAGVAITWVKHGMVPALVVLLISLLLVAASMALSIRSAAKGKLSRSALILQNEENENLPQDEENVFVGREGVAMTVMHPAGLAEFDGVRLNVVSEGDYIEKGTRVVISQVEGVRIVVKPV